MKRGIRTQLKKGRIAQMVEQRTAITGADIGFNHAVALKYFLLLRRKKKQLLLHTTKII